MAWRKQKTHREETKDVRAALQRAGINAKVGHGTGTAWGWLYVNIGSGQQWGEHVKGDDGFCLRSGCPRCENLRIMSAQALKIAQEATGRHGEYDGEINIYSQSPWNERKGISETIEHPEWCAPVATCEAEA